jgi:ubiquinone/menaquinone biosynthesis C-methylase UbiE
MRKILDRLIESLASNPVIFNLVRRVLENDFVVEKRVIRAQLLDRPGPRHVLDVGCGTGYFATQFDPRLYVGIDYSARFVTHALHAHPGYRFCREDARRLSFPAGTFDDVLVLGILHHLSDPDAAQVMTELHRVLRLGGRALVMEDARHDEHTCRTSTAWARSRTWACARSNGPTWAITSAPVRSTPGCSVRDFVDKTFTTHSGVCYYQVFVLRRSDPP